MKKKYISPMISIYATELTNALMNVSGTVSGGLQPGGGDDPDEGEDMGAKKSFNIWND